MKRDTSLRGADGAEKSADRDVVGPILWSILALAIWLLVEVFSARASYDTSLSKDTFSEHVEGLVLVPLLSHIMPFNISVMILSAISIPVVLTGLIISVSYLIETEKIAGFVLQCMFFTGIIVSVFSLSMSAVSVPSTNAISKVDSVLSAQEVSYNENYRLGEDASLASIADLLEDDSQVNNVLGEDVGGRVYVSEDKNHNMTVYYATNGLQSPSDLKEVGAVAQDKKNVMKSIIGGK